MVFAHILDFIFGLGGLALIKLKRDVVDTSHGTLCTLRAAVCHEMPLHSMQEADVAQARNTALFFISPWTGAR